jgi:hypothetical protein
MWRLSGLVPHLFSTLVLIVALVAIVLASRWAVRKARR